ncbi:MAG: EAL domain-containing protein [Pseudomonadales bacterium]|nr:EAL domain-containing protein [Pseudomonadales bacterium]
MGSEETIHFMEENAVPHNQEISTCFNVLSVDSDQRFQNALGFSISSMKILGHRINFLKAQNHESAANILASSNIAIALLEVESLVNDPALKLVRTLREHHKNTHLRIILTTAQPGLAPAHRIMREFDINDYWWKYELSFERLETILTTNLRSFQQLKDIACAKRGLQLIAESSHSLYSSTSLKSLSFKLLAELSRLLKIPNSGFVCTPSRNTHGNMSTLILGATGDYCNLLGCCLENQCINNHAHIQLINRLSNCLHHQQSVYSTDHAILLFSQKNNASEYLIYLDTDRPLDATELELLKVFSVNIQGGIFNVSLISRLDQLAFEDQLLRIPNKNALLSELDRQLAQENRHQMNLVITDVDNFSSINTVLGQNSGDQILKNIADMLLKKFPESVFIARIKDDQFALLGPCDRVNNETIAALFNNKETADTSIHEQPFSPNISTVTFPLTNASRSARDTLTRAGISLKKAKKKGIKQQVIYKPKDEFTQSQQFNLLLQFQKALDANQISVVFQPQLNIKTGCIKGIELLSRWVLPNGTEISPNQFIPLAEATGLIVQLGQQVMLKAIAVAKQLKGTPYEHLKIGVNLSVVQFEQENLQSQLSSWARISGVHPNKIEIEITESVAMSNFALINEKLRALRELAFSFAIDDFGTGFSSLSCLNQLSANRLKIDKSFIEKVTTDNGASAIVKSIINLGEQFKLNVIAEGVETNEQFQWLKHAGCDEIQGFWLAKPMAFDELLRWLGSRQAIAS